ncbi:MAG: ATP-dependent sacrificial sulfur transferase LarE [Acetatifactor sp.]
MTLRDFFGENREVALAFSGGVDSAYLLYAAKQYGAKVCAYYVKTEFQPEFELRDARQLATQIGAKMRVLEADILSEEDVARNSADRCYYCKKLLFSRIQRKALEDGYKVLMEGTNASDDEDDRPGMRALRELSVRSPLRECGLTKAQIRSLSREAGLFTWDKPSYACLATRIPTGTEITVAQLKGTETVENYLFSMGFRDFRVRYLGGSAKLQVQRSQLSLVLEKREEIQRELKKYYQEVLLDLEVRQ